MINEQEKYGYIYKITCNINNKIYKGDKLNPVAKISDDKSKTLCKNNEYLTYLNYAIKNHKINSKLKKIQAHPTMYV